MSKGGADDDSKGENPRCVPNTPWIPGNDIVITASQIAHELTVSGDEVDTGFSRTTCGTSEWRLLSGKRQKRADLGWKGEHPSWASL